jgi:hypothetical protein
VRPVATPWWDDDTALADALAATGRELALDAPPVEVRRGAVLHWLAAAAVVVAVAAATVLSIAPARHTVGGWFRVGNVDVRVVPGVTSVPADSLPGLLDGTTVRPAGAAAVGAVLGADLDAVSSSALGPPARWWVLPEGGVVAEWPARATTLWVVELDGFSSMMLEKLVGGAETVVALPDLGDRPGGMAVSGGHLLVTPHRTIAATDVVAWTEQGRVYRLESSGVGVDELEVIADGLA